MRSAGGQSARSVEGSQPWNADETLVYADALPRRVLTRSVAAVTLTAYAAYLVYRALFTFNPEAPIFSTVVYLAEVHGFFAFFFFVFQLWSLRRRSVPQPPPGLRVDVFITTYNEDLSLLRQTVRGALRMRYPHRTFILDDGRRAAVRQLARELGCGYITRPTNEHAKAGNWNNAFRQTDADFIATFDADHVPRPAFLERTLGFFRDPGVALVQVPQQYHNFDSIQHRVDWNRKRMHAEQAVFFDLIMPGKDHYNAAFFCGTGAVLRRSTLAPHGGIITGTITEDLHTSLVLHSEGWKSVYVHENLVTGLAPMDLTSFATQRLRWAEGNLKVMGHINPITCSGLSTAQRINYFASLYHWTTGIPKLVYYLSPPWMLVSGTFPIANFNGRLLAFYLVFLFTLVVGYKVVSRGTGRLLLDELYSMVSFFTLLRACKRVWLGRGTASIFQVTDKNGSGSDAQREVMPHLVLLAASIAALSWSWMGLGFGVRDDAFGAGVAAFWTFYNMALMGMTIQLAVRPVQKRQSFRSHAHLAVDAIDVTGGRLVGMTSNVSEHGCTLLWPNELQRGGRLTLRFHIGPRILERLVEVRGEHRAQRGVFSYGVQFVSPSQHELDEFQDLLHQVVIPDLFGGLSQQSTFAHAWRSSRARLPRMLKPRARRKAIVVPVQVSAPGGSFLSVTSDISDRGLSVVAPRRLAIGTRVRAQVMIGSDRPLLEGEVVRESPRADSDLLGTWRLGIRVTAIKTAAAAALNHTEAASVA